MMIDDFSPTDRMVMAFDGMLRIVMGGDVEHTRESPAHGVVQRDLLADETRHSAGLMRINHTGEVCAQALYQGQAMTSHSQALRVKLRQAQLEEMDHLAWCAQRLDALGSRASFLNPLWYVGSLSLGMMAGAMGDAWNLGFLAETERQVETHLHAHVEEISVNDRASRAVLMQMKIDEANHATMAEHHGARSLPGPIKAAMRGMARLMKAVVYYI